MRAREPAKPQQQTYSAFRFGASQLGPSRLVGSVREISAEEQVRYHKGSTGQMPCVHAHQQALAGFVDRSASNKQHVGELCRDAGEPAPYCLASRKCACR